jgi:hypothetical protein
MGEIKCEILKDYGDIILDENNSIKICEVSWNGRKPKGIDIRKCSEGKVFKGITIPYESMNNMVEIIIDNGLANINDIKKYIKSRENSYFDDNDFNNMFKQLNSTLEKYFRDNYGYLRDSDGKYVICSRRKK